MRGIVEVLPLLLHSLVRQDMHGYCSCEKDEEQAQGPMPSYEEGTVKKGDPYHAHGHHLHTQWQGFMHHEVLDVWSESRMLHQPSVQGWRTLQEQEG